MRRPSDRIGRCAALVLLLALAACGREGPPAPVVTGGIGDEGGYGVPVTVAPHPYQSAAPAYGAGPQPLAESAGGDVVVQKGETLYAVARHENVPVRSLIDANDLQPPYYVHAGERLKVPHIRSYVVQPGETLYAVSRRFGVEATTLAEINHLQPPYTIKAGLPLVLPPPAATGGDIAAVQPAPQDAPPPTPVAFPPPVPGAPIALTPPPEKSPETAVPPTVPPPAAPAVPSPAPSAPPAAQGPAEPEEQPPVAAAVPAPPSGAAAVAEAVASHRPPSAPIFFWPVHGRIISVFGAASGGMHNDGINIVAPEGTTVSAAENGVVAYAGNELKGFGNLVLIKHNDGWISAYAHNKVLLVKKGDKVRRGQPIAEIGTTGGVTAPQLHFELRLGTKAIDPLDHLPQLASGAG